MARQSSRLETRADFETRWRLDIEFAERQLLEQGSLSTMFVIHGRSMAPLSISGTWETPEGKAAFYDMARLACIANDAIGVASMAEAWMVLGEPSLEVPPSESERRQECMIVLMVGRLPETGNPVHLVSIKRIERGSDGKIIGLTPIDLPDDDTPGVGMGGEMLAMLPPETPSAAVRRKARAALERKMKRMRRGKSPSVH